MRLISRLFATLSLLVTLSSAQPTPQGSEFQVSNKRARQSLLQVITYSPSAVCREDRAARLKQKIAIEQVLADKNLRLRRRGSHLAWNSGLP